MNFHSAIVLSFLICYGQCGTPFEGYGVSTGYESHSSQGTICSTCTSTLGLSASSTANAASVTGGTTSAPSSSCVVAADTTTLTFKTTVFITTTVTPSSSTDAIESTLSGSHTPVQSTSRGLTATTTPVITESMNSSTSGISETTDSHISSLPTATMLSLPTTISTGGTSFTQPGTSSSMNIVSCKNGTAHATYTTSTAALSQVPPSYGSVSTNTMPTSEMSMAISSSTPISAATASSPVSPFAPIRNTAGEKDACLMLALCSVMLSFVYVL